MHKEVGHEYDKLNHDLLLTGFTTLEGYFDVIGSILEVGNDVLLLGNGWGKPVWVVRARNWKLRGGENRLSGLLEGVSSVSDHFTVEEGEEIRQKREVESEIHWIDSDIFHVSMLRRYRSDPTHVMPVEEIELYPDLLYEEEPVEILTLDSKVLRRLTGFTALEGYFDVIGSILEVGNDVLPGNGWVMIWGETSLGGPSEELEALGRLGLISQSKLESKWLWFLPYVSA
ncbi:hypothetical protein GQ457_05G020510 [Hibiscus cannabinus]